MTFTEREALYFPVLVAAFLRHSLPPEWGPAIAHQESAFTATATNNSAGDATRGGSLGLCQMSLLTARSLGFAGAPGQLLDPELNAELAATLCAHIVSVFKTRDLRDVASAYNSGKPFARAPKSTRNVYVPRVVAFATAYGPRAQETAAALAAASSAAAADAPPSAAPAALRSVD